MSQMRVQGRCNFVKKARIASELTRWRSARGGSRDLSLSLSLSPFATSLSFNLQFATDYSIRECSKY
jgi:hypothetical protein